MDLLCGMKQILAFKRNSAWIQVFISSVDIAKYHVVYLSFLWDLFMDSSHDLPHRDSLVWIW